jgi:hypothetical protein
MVLVCYFDMIDAGIKGHGLFFHNFSDKPNGRNCMANRPRIDAGHVSGKKISAGKGKHPIFGNKHPYK